QQRTTCPHLVPRGPRLSGDARIPVLVVHVRRYRGLIEPGLDPALVHKVRVWLAIGPIITPVAIAVSFVSTTVALLIYLTLPVVFIFFNPVSRYLERLRETEP